LPFFARAQLASAAAWAPDPKNPPFFLDPARKDGEPQADVITKRAANAPLAFIDQYIGNLRRYHAIAIDVGDQDAFESMPTSCTMSSTTMALPTTLRFITVPIPAPSPTAFKTM
jgi:hypothetical protein